MSEASSEASSPQPLSLTVRLSSGERLSVVVASSSATVGDTKVAIAEARPSLEEDRQRLVYKGRILEDASATLSSHGISQNGTTLFLVLSKKGSGGSSSSSAKASTGTNTSSSANNTANNTTNNTANSSNPNTGFPPMMSNPMMSNPMMSMFGGSPGSGSSTSTSPNSNPFQNAMNMNTNQPPSAQQMQQMMQSPMMQSLMDNPEQMRSLLRLGLRANPQLRSAMEANPQLREVLDDPEMLDQMVRMMRDPQAMQQAQRNQELAMSQLENMPGGFAALSSMYRDFQEPLMDGLGGGETPSTMDAPASTGLEGSTGAAMPNPWGASSSSSNNSSTPASSSSNHSNATPFFPPPGASAFNPWGAPQATGGQPQGMPMPDPDRLLAMMENPMMQQMIQQMADQNPDALREALEQQNPMFRQMFAGNPSAANQMIRQAMNPQAIRSMLEMQRAMGGGTGAGAGTGAGMDFSSLLGGGPASGTSTSSSSSPQDLSSVMEQMRAMMGGAAATGGAAGFSNPWLQTQPQQPQHPADRYRSQLESLRAMGFDDERRCLELLQRHHGNLNRAVDALLSEPEAQAPQVEAAVTTEAPTESQAPPAANDPSPEPPLHDPKDARDKKDD